MFLRILHLVVYVVFFNLYQHFSCLSSPTNQRCKTLAHLSTEEHCCEVVVNQVSSKPKRAEFFFPANHCTITFIDVCTHSPKNSNNKEVSVASGAKKTCALLRSDRARKHMQYAKQYCYLQNIHHKLCENHFCFLLKA